jgi:glycosyltransferase involved in cell wall biosynthesis
MQSGRRYRQLSEMWLLDGPKGISDRVRAKISEWLAPNNIIMPVTQADVLAADLSRPFQPAIPDITSGQPLSVNWVAVPGGPRAGGHTTMFRIIRYLESHGCLDRLYFYNVHHADHQYYESIVRSYYGFHGTVGTVQQGMEDAHAVIATSWPTAYAVFNSRCAGKRFYFGQDYEPYFYPVGSLSLLAENTYRMGLHGITAGPWLAQKLRVEFGMSTDSFEFGSDTRRYRRQQSGKRSGVVFYARPEAARRGFELGLMALEILADRQKDLDFHFYGKKMGKLPFRFFDHGRVSPEELNNIYNSCYAGLSLSLTNASLVPHEMLAAGCIPVVNDADHNRLVLDNPYVRYAPPNPMALATELERVVMARDFEPLSRMAAASVSSSTWDDAAATVETIMRRNIACHTQSTKAGYEMCQTSRPLVH